MSFAQYVRGLLPSFKRTDIVDAINKTQSSINTHTLPAYVNAERSAVLRSAKAKTVKSQHEDIVRRSNKKAGKSAISIVKANLENASRVMDLIGDTAKTVFSDTETNLAMTYPKATALRIVQTADFYNDYARKALNYWLIEETLDTSPEGVGLDITKAERRWLLSNFDNFLEAGKALENDIKDFEKQLKALPDAVISEASEAALTATIGEGKLDPLDLRHFSNSWNPVHAMVLFRANRQAAAYTAAKEELKLLENRIFNLEKLKAGEQEAWLQSEIEILQDKTSGLNSKLNELDKQYGL